MKNSHSTISIIIPAKNEEENIATTLNAIKEQCFVPHEVIVVDHNSTDKTAKVASSFNAKVIKKVGGTIGDARNTGVQHAIYNTLAFIDADISLTAEWNKNIKGVLDILNADQNMITGSRCIPNANGSRIERQWFANLPKTESLSHIGTGHMIIPKSLFLKLNGFNPSLSTGEDYDLCKRAQTAGARIVNSPQLKVIHRHYPKSIKEFFMRERWHGKSDFTNSAAIMHSKVAIATILFATFHLLFTIGCFAKYLPICLFSALGIAGLLGISTLSLFKTCSTGDKLINFLLFYVYYLGRFASMLDAIRENVLRNKSETRWR